MTEEIQNKNCGEAMWTAADCPRCDGERVIHAEDRPHPNDISPTAHQEPCPECSL